MQTMHLFAGGGGGLLADLILGHNPIIAVEWEPYACQILRERAADGWFPDLHVWEGDVRLFDPSEYAGRVDCIHAGFPCQPFSHAGARKGSTDVRGDLFMEVLRCVETIRPKYVFLENVAGLLTSESPVCVCGWPYRRGGVLEDSKANKGWIFDIHAHNKNCNVEQGGFIKDATGKRVWREGVRREEAVGEMGGRMEMEYHRGRSDGIPCENLPISHAEEETSGIIDGITQAEKLATNQEEWAESLDARSEKESGGDERQDAHSKYDRAECPRCGRGLVSASRHIRYMDAIFWSLSSIGYDCRWLTLRASDVGAPHHRDRWWCLCTRRADMADTEGRQSGQQAEWQGREDSCGRSAEIPDTIGIGQQGHRQYERCVNSKADCDREADRIDNLRKGGEGRGFAESDLGQLADGLASPLDANQALQSWWEVEPQVGRVTTGCQHRAAQLKALGNGQVPMQAAVAFSILMKK